MERVASVATAIGVTVATALVVLSAQVAKGGTAPRSAPADESTVERVVYVAPPPPTLVAPSRPLAHSSARTVPAVNATLSAEPASTPSRDSASLAPAPTVPLVTGGAPVADAASGGVAIMRAANSPRSTAGAPIAGARVGFTYGPVEGAAPPPFKPLPPTQAEVDAKWRDQAFEAAAARGAGVPVRATTALGGVSVPLPFGGPSKKHRERDRAIEAQLKVLSAARQRRIDSVLAARNQHP